MGTGRFRAIVSQVALVAATLLAVGGLASSAPAQLSFRNDGIGRTGPGLGLPAVQHPLPAPLPRWHPEAQVDPGWSISPPLPPRTGPQNTWVRNSGVVEVDVSSGRPKVSPMSPFMAGESLTLEQPGDPGATTPQLVDGSAGTVGEVSPFIVIGPDGRKKVTTTTLYPWRTMVKLRMTFNGQTYIGSGIMVSRTHVLTAGHCVYDRALGGYASRIEVIPGLNGSFAPYGRAYAKTMRTFTGWINGENTDWDMALITLDRNIGASCGFMGMAAYTTTALQRQYITIGGYPFDRDAGNSLYYMSGNILRVEPDQLHYTIDTAGGQSGSGIWRVVSAQRYVIGVHAFGVFGSPGYNGGTRLTPTKLNQIKAWIALGT